MTPEPPRKGRGNAILTYETVEEIRLGIQRVDMKVDRLDEKLAEESTKHTDHEVRIRALELAFAGTSGGTGFAKWLGPILITLAGLGISILNYLKP